MLSSSVLYLGFCVFKTRHSYALKKIFLSKISFHFRLLIYLKSYVNKNLFSNDLTQLIKIHDLL